MRPEVTVGLGAALLVSALAGIEWWAEHEWRGDSVVVRPTDVAGGALPETSEVDTTEASASPSLSR